MKYFKKANNIDHVLVFGKQGTGKDMLIVSWLKKFYDQGITIYSNSPLKFDYVPIRSIADIRNSYNGILYFHDMDLIFNSRDFILRKAQDKQQTLLELVNNMRKRKLSLIGSCHRPRSIDVKVRSLINYWVNPQLVCVNSDDDTNLWNYRIYYDVYDEYGVFSRRSVLRDLPKYAVLYDTFDCVSPLSG